MNRPYRFYFGANVFKTQQTHLAVRLDCFVRFLLLVRVLAALVGNAAAGLAGGLARGLALAAAAVLGAVAEIAGVQGHDMLHGSSSISMITL